MGYLIPYECHDQYIKQGYCLGEEHVIGVGGVGWVASVVGAAGSRPWAVALYITRFICYFTRIIVIIAVSFLFLLFCQNSLLALLPTPPGWLAGNEQSASWCLVADWAWTTTLLFQITSLIFYIYRLFSLGTISRLYRSS